jgi:hypothetical protein
VQFHVRSGRIYALNDTPGGRLNFGAKSLGREENLTVDLSGPYPAVDYAIVTRKSRLSIAISDGHRLRAMCLPQGSQQTPAVSFDQNPDADVCLRVESASDTRELRGDSLWHLFMADPELAGEHLAPILRVLRPGWPLAEQAREVEAHLFAQARSFQPPDRRRMAALVEQLADIQFGARQEADRQLREIGTGALPYLRSLDFSALDAEQQFRVRRIVATFADAAQEDVPVQVARRLLSDPQVWLSLLTRDDAQQREAACDHLSQLLGEPIEFDPAADAAVRERQLAALRGQFGG